MRMYYVLVMLGLFSLIAYFANLYYKTQKDKRNVALRAQKEQRNETINTIK